MQLSSLFFIAKLANFQITGVRLVELFCWMNMRMESMSHIDSAAILFLLNKNFAAVRM